MKRGRLAQRCPFALGLGAALALFSGAQSVPAADIDLRTEGSEEMDSQGAIWSQQNMHPTGTGVYDPFLRVQNRGVEEGFNTDAENVLDNKPSPWTHSVRMGDLDVIVGDGVMGVLGVEYFAFDLDINEPESADKQLLSLDKFQLYTVTGDPAIDSLAQLMAQGQLQYDMDGGAEGDRSVYLDSGLAPGSGHDDMSVWVRKSDFVGYTDDSFLYLYSAFGSTEGMAADEFDSGGGFEEWAARMKVDGDEPGGGGPPPPQAPEPGTLVLLANGLLVGFVATRGRRKKT